MIDKKKKRKITNPNYRRFLDKGIIFHISEENIKAVINGIEHRYRKEARSLVIALYYTGARPNEILKIKGKDITRDNRNILIVCPPSKGGLPRTVTLPFKLKLVKELYDYSQSTMPEALLFWHFKGHSVVKTKTQKGIKLNINTAYKVRDYFYKWFKNSEIGVIPPYYLRHDRFSKLIEKGADMQDIRMLKGSKTLESVTPYLHMSLEKSKKLGRLMD